jgi:4-hydroxy-2-oxoheptanedioate aldolase
MLTGDPADAARYFDMGFTFVAVGSDLAILAQGAAKRAADMREHLARRAGSSLATRENGFPDAATRIG